MSLFLKWYRINPTEIQDNNTSGANIPYCRFFLSSSKPTNNRPRIKAIINPIM